MQNQFVNPLIQNQLLNGVENQYLISKTDPYGKIIFCNSLFEIWREKVFFLQTQG